MTWAVLAVLGTLQGSLPGVPPSSLVPHDADAATSYLLQLGDGFGSWNAWEAAFQCYRAALLKKPANARGRVRIARALFRVGRLPEAVQEAGRALSAMPQDPEAIRVFAGVHLAAGESRLAEQTLRPLLETNRDDGDALRLLGTALMQLGKLDEADEMFHRAAYATPSEPESFRLLAELAVARKEPEKVVGFLKRYIDLAPDRPDGYGFLVQTYLSLNKPAEALLTGMVAAEKDPHNPQLLLTCAKLLAGAQRLDDAAQWFRRALDTGVPPAVLEAAPALAQYSLQRGKWADAATYCRLGLAVDLAPPADAPAEVREGQARQIQGTKLALRGMLVNACMAQLDFGGAADAVGPVVALQPSNPGVWMQWIELLLRARRGDTLRRALRGLIDQFPNAPPLYGRAIELAVAFGRTAELLPILQTAVAQHPEQLPLGLLYYSALRRTSHDDEADALLDTLRDRFAGHPMVLREVGMLRFAHRDYGATVATLGPLMGAHMLDPDGVAALAWALQFQGDFLHAAQAFGALASPQRPEGLFDVARQYVSAGRFPEAAQLYDQILKARPGLSAALLGKARAVANAGGLADCLPLFQKVLTQDPHNAVALRGQVLAWLGLGKVDEARRAVEQYHRDGPRDEVSTMLAGDVEALTHDWLKIADSYLAGITAHPRSSLLRIRLADLYQSADKNPSEALANYQTAAELSPTDWYPRWQLADALSDRGEFAQAARYWREVLDRMPDQPWPQRLWLHNLEQAEGPDMTLASGLQWLQGQPRRVEQVEPLVDFAQAAGRLDALRDRLDSLVAPPAKAPPAALRDAFGLTLLRAGRAVEATQWYERAQREDARNPLWSTRLGEAWEQRGDLPAANRHYLRAAHVSPDDAAAVCLVAKVEGATGQAEAAIGRLEQMLRTDPSNFGVLARALRQYSEQGLLARVLPRLRTLVEGDAARRQEPLPQARTPYAWAALAYGCELSHLPYEAAAHYRRALSMAPDFTEARLALARLTKRPFKLPPFPDAAPARFTAPDGAVPGAAGRPFTWPSTPPKPPAKAPSIPTTPPQR